MTTCYAVNTKTKEHIKIPNMRYKPQGVEWKVAMADDRGWVNWHGQSKESPLPVKQSHEVLTLDGEVLKGLCSEEWGWCWYGKQPCAEDIIAYRPLNVRFVGEAGMEKQEWNGKGLPPVDTVCEAVCTDGNWHEVEIVFVNREQHVAVFECPVSAGLSYYWQTEDRFRTLDTQKKKVIENLSEYIFDNHEFMNRTQSKVVAKLAYQFFNEEN